MSSQKAHQRQTRSPVANQLKSQADSFYKNGLYNAAFDKYSEAIKVEPQDPVLYSNRAAASIASKEYLEARRDAEKATELDPKFSKAWCRLGVALNALGYWNLAVRAWQSAIDTLPSGKLSAKDQQLKKEYMAGLRSAKKGADTPVKFLELKPYDLLHNLPWHCAGRLRAELIEKQQHSTALVILRANKLFKTGVDLLAEQERLPTSDGTQLRGESGAIGLLCDAITRDMRTFHLPGDEFLDQYAWQRAWEFFDAGASNWEKAGPKVIKEEALRKLRTSGWDSVRSALTLTVKYWIFDCFLQNAMQQHVSQEMIKNAINILEWGRNRWADVPKDQRGEIFERYYIRGVKSLYLYQLLEAHIKNLNSQDEQAKWEEWEETTKLAHEIIEDCESDPPHIEFDPQTDGEQIETKFTDLFAFWIRPRSEAHSNLGKYYELRALDPRAKLSDRRLYWEKSGKHLLQAATNLTRDDERYPMYLRRLLVANWNLGAPLRATLPICEEICACLPAVRKIWDKSYLFDRCKPYYKEVSSFLKENKRLLESGRMGMTLDDIVCPPDIIPLDFPSNHWIPLLSND